MFAGRRISLPSIWAIAIVVVVGFAAGIGVGWGTGLVADRLTAPEPTISPTPSPTPTVEQNVTVPPMEPITRERDAGDALAGINSLEIMDEGTEQYVTATQDAEPSGAAASVRSVRVEYEDGLAIDGEALSGFVMNTLNDPRGWGARGRYEFIPTEGASDLRVVLASPFTAAAACPDPHTAAGSGGALEEQTDTTADAGAESTTMSPSPGEPSPDPGATSQLESCADRGIVMVSQYDWVAGLAAYGEDRTAARQYLINHFTGHALGDSDGICGSGTAQIMTDQAQLPEECEANAWPWPDEPVGEPETSPSPTAQGDEGE